MQRRTVLLPEPLGPTTTTTSPRLTSRSTPRTASMRPKYLCRFLMTIISLFMALILAQAPLVPAQQQAEHQRERQVGEGEYQIGLAETEGAARIEARTLCQVVYGKHRNERGILEHGNKIVAQGRRNIADGLRQDNEAHRLGVAHAQRARRLHLSRWYRFDAGAENLGQKSAVNDRQGGD